MYLWICSDSIDIHFGYLCEHIFSFLWDRLIRIGTTVEIEIGSNVPSTSNLWMKG